MHTMIIFLLALLCALIPIVLWGYLFSFFDDHEANRKRFVVGIFAGMISVVPVLKLGEILTAFELPFFNIFSRVHALSGLGDIAPALLAFLFVLILLSCIPFVILGAFSISRDQCVIFGKNLLIFSFFSVILVLILYGIQKVLGQFQGLNASIDTKISFGEVVFNSFKLIVLYYILIGVIEELSKFFCFSYSKYFEITSIKSGVLSAMFVALGFAFLENILYFQSLYEEYGMGKELTFSYFSRNIFSVILHVLCSSFFAYYFSKAYLVFRYRLSRRFLIWIFTGFVGALGLHALFDIFLTFNYTFMVIVYLMGSYFYLTFIFYGDETTEHF